MKITITDSGNRVEIRLTELQSVLAAGRARLANLDEQRASFGDVARRLVIARERLIKQLRQEEERADALRAYAQEAEHDRDKAADALARAELVPNQVSRTLEDALVHREQLEARHQRRLAKLSTDHAGGAREKALEEAGAEHAAELAAVDEAIEAAHRERVAAYQAVDDARAELRARERDVTEIVHAAGDADHRAHLVAEREAIEQQVAQLDRLEARAAQLRQAIKRAEGPGEDGARGLVIAYLREVWKAADVRIYLEHGHAR